ncbi:MAG: Ig-like domain-containing protein, partial [Bacteroidota bacterium]
ASGNAVINAQPLSPAISVGSITNPATCGGNGNFVLNFTNVADGTYTIAYSTGSFTGITVAGSTATIATTVGTYNDLQITVNGCTSPTGVNATLNDPAAPSAPTVGAITQPTCGTATGSVALSGLPASGTWTINPGSITGTGASTTLSGIATGTHNFTVTNAAGCTSTASANVVINAQPQAPTAPIVGAITQPTCGTATGSVALSGLPASGNWTVTVSTGGTMTGSGAGTAITFNGVTTGTRTFTVTNTDGCTSPASGNAVINAQPLSPAISVGSITNPATCGGNGSVVLNLTNVADGTYTIAHSTGSFTGVIVAGSTATIATTVGTYNDLQITVNGCTSPTGVNATLNDPAAPSAPTVGAITQPTCGTATGSVALSGLPASGTWTINPGGITGSGTSTTLSGLATGTHNFTVTNAAGCTSPVSANVVINAQPLTPAAPIVEAIIQPTCGTATGSVTLGGLPASGTWTVTVSSGGTITGSDIGTSITLNGITTGTRTFTVTNADGCTSPASGDAVINAQPLAPAAPTGSAAQSFCAAASTVANLNATGTAIRWYAASSGGTALAGSTALVNGTHYYASQTVSDCESTSRLDVVATVNACNTPPVITSNGGGATATTTIAENTTLVTTVTATDIDLPAQTLTFSITGGADQALFAINGTTGVLNFVTAPNFESPADAGANNVYDVQVTVTDNGTGNLTDVQDLAITVTNVNEPPVAVADSYSVLKGGTLTVAAPGVLGNDSDPDGNTVTAIKVTDPVNGTLTLNANGSFTFIHNGSATTSDSFTYKVNDGTLDGNTVTVSITINPVSPPPPPPPPPPVNYPPVATAAPVN